MATAATGESARAGPWSAALLSATSAAGAVALGLMIPQVAAGDPVQAAWPWIPSLGIELSFMVDGLGLLFALLIAGIGAFIALYAGAYLRGHPRQVRFVIWLAVFEASMLGLVLADDLMTLFVFWELTTISSFMLIGFQEEEAKARRNALQSLLITGIGGLALLAGFLLIADAAGTFSISEIRAGGDLLRDHELYLAILVLVFAGAFTKSAQVPFHVWLPNAMAAPTPVSAYLHSATMVKAGIYLLARFHDTLGGTPEWIWTLTLVGAATAVWASVLAVRQTDLKLALAYTTLMALGTLTMFLGADSDVGISAAVTFLIVHALYKSALFLVVGNIDHGAGTREIDRLGGLRTVLPFTAVAAAIAAMSMAGFPPFLGFIGKELKYEGALAIASEPWLVTTAAVSANALMIVVAGMVALRPFFGNRRAATDTPHEAPFAMLAGPLVLAGLGLVFGILTPEVNAALVQPAVAAVLNGPVQISLKLWHGINLPLLLSVLTLSAGLTLYAAYPMVRGALTAALDRFPVDSDRCYDAVMAGLVRLAGWQTRLLQGGLLRRYLFFIFATLAGGVGLALITAGVAWTLPVWPDLPLYQWAIVVAIMIGTFVSAVTHSRLAAICALGIVGSGVSLIFLFYGAPDVAMTQILVEILFVVIIAIVLLRLPSIRHVAERSSAGRLRDAALAVLSGGVIAVLTLLVTATPPDLRISEYFAEASKPEAHGGNIVNVILVDFRAFDTLGEIIVVGTAALAVFSLIAARRWAGRLAEDRS